MAQITAIPGVDAANYPRHTLHSNERNWVEKNCYVDVWIELIHALGMEPLAMLPFTIAIDFEGDQWTFFKPPHNELRDLYGLDVQELNVWRPLIDHVAEHLSDGRLISTEADAFWLPDTAGTDYRRQHTKSTIIIAEIDIDAMKLGYFHNAGYFELAGEDFQRTFRLGVPEDPAFMPLFAETIKQAGKQRLANEEVRAASRRLWRAHLRRIPEGNPVGRFRMRFERDLNLLQANGLAYYHAWAFGTTRQLGAAMELAASNLDWLGTADHPDLEIAASRLKLISAECKTFILKGARAVNSKKALDPRLMFDAMEKAWEQSVTLLRNCFDT